MKKRKNEEEKEERTRPDTRPPVADRWAGAEMRVFLLFDSIITDRRTDKASYRVACPQLKTDKQSTRHFEMHTYKRTFTEK